MIDSAVDKTFEKLAGYLREEGLVLTSKRNCDRGKTLSCIGNKLNKKITKAVSCQTGNDKLEEEIGRKIARIADQSTSGTTIYDKAVQSAQNKESGEIEPKRISTSSDEIDTSEEMIDMTGHFNSIDFISKGREPVDWFYDERPQPGVSRRTHHGEDRGKQTRE